MSDEKYRVRAVRRKPPTHKIMGHYIPLESDEGVVTDAVDVAAAIDEVLKQSPDGYVVVGLVANEQNGS